MESQPVNLVEMTLMRLLLLPAETIGYILCHLPSLSFAPSPELKAGKRAGIVPATRPKNIAHSQIYREALAEKALRQTYINIARRLDKIPTGKSRP